MKCNCLVEINSIQFNSIRYIVCNGHYVNTAIIATYVISGDEVLPAKANGGAEIPELSNWT